MAATAAQTQINPSAPLSTSTEQQRKVTKSARRISWATFQRRFLEREDKFKYEWAHGVVVKTPRSMNQQQQFILLNLEDFLAELRGKNKKIGKFLSEVDTFFGPNHRRPDIAYFSPEQILLLRSANQEPQFVIEVISNSDQLNAAHEKLEDYRAVSTQVVWHVFPKLQQVHVYRGKNMVICLGDDPCSAEPVIPGFVLPTKDIFK